MKFEDLQNQWQKEGGDIPLQVSYDMLLKEVRRNQCNFDSEILWRDIIECAASLFGVCCLVVFGIWLDTMFYVPAVGMLYLAIFFIIYRRFRPQKTPAGTASLRTCAEESLCEVECQIKLLKNVFWWYLLLPGLGIAFPFIKISYSLIHGGYFAKGLIFLGGYVIGDILITWWVYWLNQNAVKKELLPRKQELEDLLHTMGNGSQGKPVTDTVNLWTVCIISILITMVLSTLLLFAPKISWLEDTMKGDEQVAIEITPLLSPEEAIGPRELKILSARYGAKEQWVDVTQKVVDAVHGNTLSIHSGNELAGKDPCFLATKILEIECLWDGHKKTIRVREGSDLKIPSSISPYIEQQAVKTPEDLYSLAKACPAEIGFYGKNFTTGMELAYRQDQPACMASIVKIFVLLELCRQMESESIHPQDPVTISYEDKKETCSVNDAIDRMIGISDNEATAALARLVGYNQVNALAGQLAMKGLSSTILPEEGLAKVLDMRVYEQKVVPESQLPPQHGTARGIVNYFELLNDKKLINEAVSKRVLEAMNRNPKRFAPDATPARYQSVGKGGSLLWVRPDRQEYTMLGWGVYIYNEKEALAFCIWAEWFPVDMVETQQMEWIKGLSNYIVNLLLLPENRIFTTTNKP